MEEHADLLTNIRCWSLAPFTADKMKVPPRQLQKQRLQISFFFALCLNFSITFSQIFIHLKAVITHIFTFVWFQGRVLASRSGLNATSEAFCLTKNTILGTKLNYNFFNEMEKYLVYEQLQHKRNSYLPFSQHLKASPFTDCY